MGNRIRWIPNEAVLPMKSTLRGSLLAGVIFSLFSALLGACFIYIFTQKIIQQGFDWNVAGMLLIFLFLPVCGLLVGLGQIFHKEETEITSEKVTYSSKGLYGQREWHEPISNYDGVYKTTISGRNVRIGMAIDILVRLRHHKDSFKNISLFDQSAFSNEDELGEAMNRYAHMLSVPVLFDGKIASWEGAKR